MVEVEHTEKMEKSVANSNTEYERLAKKEDDDKLATKQQEEEKT